MSLTAKQKQEVAQKALRNNFPLRNTSLRNFVGMVERYVDRGDMIPGDKLYPFVPDGLLNVADNQ